MKRKEYTIELNKLKNGNNYFEFLINDAFLADFTYAPVKQANTLVNLVLFKRELLMELDFTYIGTAHVECDTCLTEIEMPVNATYNLLIKIAEETNFTDDEIVFLGKNEIEFDLSQYLYESFVLSLPVKKDCENLPEPKPCNKEVLSKLNNQVIKQASEGAEEHETDPRWQQLKNIIKNN